MDPFEELLRIYGETIKGVLKREGDHRLAEMIEESLTAYQAEKDLLQKTADHHPHRIDVDEKRLREVITEKCTDEIMDGFNKSANVRQAVDATLVYLTKEDGDG